MKSLQRNVLICKEKICICTDSVKDIEEHNKLEGEVFAKKCTDL
jgi:hypothetical protein